MPKVKGDSGADIRTRNFVFTINNYTDSDLKDVETLSAACTYLVYSREVGEKGTPHLQGYLVTKVRSRYAALRKLAPRAHFHVRDAPTHAQASDYCKGLCEKKGFVYNPTTVEFGTLPSEDTSTVGRLAEQARWEQARTAAKAGDFDSVPADIYLRCYSAIHKIAASHQKPVEPLAELDFHYWFGPTGTFKTLTSRRENPGAYIKQINKWWDGYDDHPCVLIDELQPEHGKFMLHFLKQWCDHHPFVAETKGGSMLIRPRKIIITSNYPLEMVFPDLAAREPLERRLQVRYFHPLPEKERQEELTRLLSL